MKSGVKDSMAILCLKNSERVLERIPEIYVDNSDLLKAHEVVKSL